MVNKFDEKKNLGNIVAQNVSRLILIVIASDVEKQFCCQLCWKNKIVANIMEKYFTKFVANIVEIASCFPRCFFGLDATLCLGAKGIAIGFFTRQTQFRFENQIIQITRLM